MKRIFTFIRHNSLFCILFTLILVISFIPRSVEVLNGNPVFGFDQGREYIMTADIFDNKNIRLIGTPLGAGAAGLQGIFHGPLYYYFLGIPYLMFQGDPRGGTLLMLLFGMGSVVAGFALGKQLFGRNGGLVLMALIGISPLMIAQSRFIWSPYPSTFFILLAFYFIFRMKERGIFLFLASFFSAFIYNFELAIAVPLSLGLLIYAPFILGKKVKSYSILLLGFIVALLPMILFEARHQFMAVQGMTNYLLTPQKSSEKFDQVGHVVSHFNSFVGNISDSFSPLFIVPSLVLGIVLITPTIYLLLKEKKKHVKKYITFLLFLPILNFIILHFLRNTVYHYYLYHLSIIYMVLFTFILVQSRRYRVIFLSFSVLFIAFICTFLFVNTKMVLYDLGDYGGIAKLQGKIDAIDYIYNDANNKEFGLLVFSPPVYTYPYDYILQWRGKKEYGYIPHQNKEGVFYLLIEKDPEKPWSYNGWLETVIKDGKVVSEVTLPSGFIIQKRIKE